MLRQVLKGYDGLKEVPQLSEACVRIAGHLMHAYEGGGDVMEWNGIGCRVQSMFTNDD